MARVKRARQDQGGKTHVVIHLVTMHCVCGTKGLPRMQTSNANDGIVLSTQCGQRTVQIMCDHDQLRIRLVDMQITRRSHQSWRVQVHSGMVATGHTHMVQVRVKKEKRLNELVVRGQQVVCCLKRHEMLISRTFRPSWFSYTEKWDEASKLQPVVSAHTSLLTSRGVTRYKGSNSSSRARSGFSV